jgi:hypothetical protein
MGGMGLYFEAGTGRFCSTRMSIWRRWYGLSNYDVIALNCSNGLNDWAVPEHRTVEIDLER